MFNIAKSALSKNKKGVFSFVTAVSKKEARNLFVQQPT
jgi:hypothetical protein